MARKVVILAREAGLRLELEDVEVQSLVPEPLRAAQSAAEFLDGLPQVRCCPVSASGAWGWETRGLNPDVFCEAYGSYRAGERHKSTAAVGLEDMGLQSLAPEHPMAAKAWPASLDRQLKSYISRCMLINAMPAS